MDRRGKSEKTREKEKERCGVRVLGGGTSDIVRNPSKESRDPRSLDLTHGLISIKISLIHL